MANHKSAEKRVRQSLKRRDRNRGVRSEVRTTVKALRSAISDGNATDAKTRLRDAEKSLRKAASKGVIKRETASRSVSRLAKAVGKLA
ncbi:MAG: 30S ribosomal protein S20 [Deltaproteobacteria bacterium]|nr:30S ribosomal protein S20 [Deltaproteobacteria bacterium]